MRQKVVSILILLGVVFSIFRCAAGDKDESVQEVALSAESETEVVDKAQAEIGHLATEEAEKVDATHAEEDVAHVAEEAVHHAEKTVEHTVETPAVTAHVAQVVKPTHDKTLFFKSDAFIQEEKIERERMAALAAAEEAQYKVHAQEIEKRERLEREKAAKLKADKEAKERASLQSEADKKLNMEREKLQILQEKATLEAENAKIKSSQESLLAKIKEWEAKATQAQSESKKLKIAAVAAAALATQQAVANATSEGAEKVEKLQSALDKAMEEKKALEVANAKIKFSQEALLEKIGEWEVKAAASEEESLKIKATGEEEVEKLKATLEEMTQEKVALEAQIEAFTEEKSKLAQANVDMNSSINSTKAALLMKIEEWEKKALEAESQEHATYTATVEKYKTVLANLTQEKVALEEENTKMKSSQEALLEKIGVWEVKVSEAEAESKKLKIAAAAAAALATQQAVANASSEGTEKVEKLQSALDEALEEKNRLTEVNSELNSTMQTTKEELLAKIQEWETKVAASEEESKKLKMAAAAAAALATQQAVANATSEGAEEIGKLQSALEEVNATKLELEKEIELLTQEKNRLTEVNSELNSTMQTTKEELSVKIQELEAKVAQSEEASSKLKTAVLAASEKLKSAETALEKMKADAANLAAQQAEEKAKAEAEALAKAQAEKEAAQRALQEKAEAKSVAKEKLASLLALSKVEFKYNSSQLTKKSEELLNSIVTIINEHPELSYDIQGHTDAHGNEDYNIKLSTSRAEKVKDYLIENGVDGNSLTAKGFGSSMPIADNSTNEGRLQNRRVVIKIVE